ncbi:MAG: NAD-dependent epimerase/dehydratase family protein [Gemmatimonadales bacterium]|nr:MAG: NAD-dependent epimerase/dehydratase family protein [Gemmatimonadales bacterium]
MRGVILLTGGTGFLGSQVARLLLKDTDHAVVVLVRARDAEEARQRLERSWSEWPDLVQAIGSRVEPLPGDLTLSDLGLEGEAWTALSHRVTHIVHSAAELRFDGELGEMRRINVEGVRHLLDFAYAAHAHHGIARYAHVSTAYVAGGRTSAVAEADLSNEHGFSNTYEQTKYEGEMLVRASMGTLPVSVFRPGMVVGGSETGAIRCFNTIYVPLRLYLSGRLRIVPSAPDLRANMVPVDYVAGAIAKLTFDPRAVGQTFHLTVAPENLPTAKELIQAARSWAETELGVSLPKPHFLPADRLAKLPGAERLGLPTFLLPYFSENRRFLKDNVERLLGPYAPDWSAIIPHLLRYAADRGFLHRTERTVHEQVLTRLQSERLPVAVHDAVDGEIRTRSGAEMSREIIQASGALRAMGIGRGHRVALVGLNSSRYLALDTAIGLSGAVSVPLYYTSPISEIGEIVKASEARLLLIGAPDVLARAGALRGLVTVASFCRGPVPENLAPGIVSWEAFLALGRNAHPAAVSKSGRLALRAPVGPSDLATLRFTSGTTGTPKGVGFTHGQLLWMAETMSALLPWKARIEAARYLSFLPMNHVVEGILSAYASYYVPARVDVTFLEDFRGLSQALPRVRPPIFFSVPRFYEKVWERFQASGAGRLYGAVSGRTGRARSLGSIMRPILRRALLRKAGLDRCAQLLVGSAPCSASLLEHFHEMGIELHNAFGLTEAPLVTLNRLGSNHLGTVGAPLPGTEVHIADDAEVLVRGPQVSAVSADGWLHTGDLGVITPEGNLMIIGRKKEILITSYGKNIHPAKIEGLLRDIPGMADAMVLGDKRPSLCALLWLSGGSATPEALHEIDRAVRGINDNLSHPEQLKRWAVLAELPGIESGELTGNLKIRRQVVLTRRAPVVEMLYAHSQQAQVSGVIHMGASKCA